MNPWGLSWTLSLEAALLVRVALSATLVLLGAYVASRLWGGALWKKGLLQATALLLCLMVLAEWLGVVDAMRRHGLGFLASRPLASRVAATPPVDPASPAQTHFPDSLPLDGLAIRSPAAQLPQVAPETLLPPSAVRDSERSSAQAVPAGGVSGTPREEREKNALAWALPRAGFLLGLWLCGTAVLLLGHLAGAACWLLRRRRWRRLEPEQPLSLQVEEVARELRLTRLPAVVVVPECETPMLGGFWFPVLILPEAFARFWSPPQQRAVLAHELAHLRHRDPFWMALIRFATALLWWHPGMWLLQRRWRWWAELAADDAAARLPQTGLHLAEALLAAARRLVSSSRGPGWWGTVAFRSPLGNRVERLLQENAPSDGSARLFGGGRWICVVLGLLLALAPATVISASDPLSTGEPTMRTAPWWRRSALTMALLGLIPAPASAQEGPRRDPPEIPHRGEAHREQVQPAPAARPERVRHFHQERARRERPIAVQRLRSMPPEERLERLVRIAEELERLGLREEAEHMRRLVQEAKKELAIRQERLRQHRVVPEHARPARPFRPRPIHRAEFRHEPSPQPPPAHEVVKELHRVVEELHGALRDTRRELEETRRHFQRELERTRRHLERVTERLEHLERLREEGEAE